MPVDQGEVLHDRYRVVKLLGQGGFGAVYRAWDLNLQRPCAIKENLESATESQEQFQREARMLSNLTHSNLPRVTDYFILPGQGQYLVMDFIDGLDLQDKLDEAGGPLPEAQALVWAEQVSDALMYLHSQKPPIIHRDIKPKNIIISPDGNAFLVDFGIAKVFDASRQTTIGARAVTPGYSPVEQYGHGKTDERSDVYALGATLYTLLTASVPVESVNRDETPLIAPRTINPQISPASENTVLTAMEVAPSRRYQTMGEFNAALQSPQEVQVAATAVVAPAFAATARASDPASAVASGPAIGAAQPAKKRTAWRAVGIVVLLLILAAAAAFVIVPAVTGGSSIPAIAALFASDTPTPTATDTPTLLPTYTNTATATRTNTPRPTKTPTPTKTKSPTITQKAAAVTKTATRTPRATATKGITPTSSVITLSDPKKNTQHIYQGGTSCGPNEVNFTISAEGPITDHIMFIFWNVQDKTTGNSIGWNSGQIMQKVRGENTWTFTFNANTMTGPLPYQEAWFIYQFILQARGGSNEKTRSPAYSDITLTNCP